MDIFLRREVPPLFPPDAKLSNSKLRRMIVAGCVSVGGRPCTRPSFILRAGSRVTADIDEDKLFYEKDNGDIEFTLEEKDVLFEDDSIIVVNKPPFLPSEETMVDGRGNMHQAVIDYLWKKKPSLRNPPYAGIMHRLDRETSGALLFTKTREVNKAVHDMFENRTATKIYRAVTTCTGEGRLRGLALPHSFSVDDYIGRVSPKSQACRMGEVPADRGGLHARTDFTLVHTGERKGRPLCFFDCELATGRTHQIRVHLSLSGFPIVGDSVYGGTEGYPENGGRIMLHARLLEFPHPLTGETVRCEAPLPPLFAP
ncbi:MAG: RluA family pseudouridine synthase [Treponema sp.]|nr:RluA family pseudouridine synthase [Treponema sp.]